VNFVGNPDTAPALAICFSVILTILGIFRETNNAEDRLFSKQSMQAQVPTPAVLTYNSGRKVALSN
jgi:hypothetical protein